MKVRTIIIVINVLICFLLNNLLFTYSNKEVSDKKEADESLTCELADNCCGNDDTGEMCCEKENCCANIPNTSSHLSLFVIIGIEKKNEAMVSASSLNIFDLSKLKTASELSEGFLNALIRPPAFA